MWMKYPIHCGTPPALAGGWEERVAIMAVLLKWVCSSSYSVEAAGRTESRVSKEALRSATWWGVSEVAGFSHETQIWCLLWSYKLVWEIYCWVHGEDELAVLLLKEIGSHLQGELLQLIHHPPFCGVSPIRNWGWSKLGGCVGGVTVSHLGAVGTFFGDMVYKSPSFELNKTDLGVFLTSCLCPWESYLTFLNPGFLIF